MSQYHILGRRSDIKPEIDEKIRVRIKEMPDITLEMLIEELSLNLTISGLSRRLAKMDLSFKKRHSTPTDKAVMM